MRRFKSLILLAVVAMMVLGLVATADAKTFSDSKATAVDALSQLGIVTGYPDGTIKPDQTITRAEFAAIVVRELGLSSDIAPSDTNFSDVDDSHWASGLINVAVGQGLIKGYPDGTFKPDANVTYAEAITILVRMLGFGPAMDETKWPAPYLATGSRIGVTDGVKVKINEAATRCDVFNMAFNSLDANVMKQDTWGTETQWREIKTDTEEGFKDSILYDKLNVYRVGDEDDPVRVTDTALVNNSLDKDTVIVGSNDSRAKADHPYGNKFGSYKLVDGLVPSDYMGMEVELWVNDASEKVEFVRVQTDASDIVSDVVDDFDLKTITDDTTGAVKVAKNFKMKSGKTYNISSNVVAYMNTLEKSKDYTVNKVTNSYIPVINRNYVADGVDSKANDSTKTDVPDFFGRAVKVILDDNGDVAYVECFKGNTWIASEDADADDEELKGYGITDSEYSIDLSDNDRYIVLKDGKTATLADIKKDDLFVVYPNPTFDGTDEDDIRLVKAFSTKVTGTLDDVHSEGGAVDDYYVTVNGKDYGLAGDIDENEYYINAWDTLSTDNNESIDALEEKDFDDLLGKQVTLFMAGTSVRHIMADTDVAGSSDIYAVLNTAEYDNFDGLRFKVTNKNGDDVTYLANDNTEFYTDEMASHATLDANFKKMYANWNDGADIDDEDNWKRANPAPTTPYVITGPYLVKIELNGSGEVSELHFLADLNTGSADIKNFTVDKNDYRMKFNGNSYSVETWASLYDVTSGVDDVSWSSMQDTQDSAGFTNFQGFVYVDDDNVVAVAVTGPVGVSVRTDAVTGVVMSRTKISDGYKLGIMVNGEVKTYNTDGENVAKTSYNGDNEGTSTGGKTTDINKGDVVVFDTNSSGEISEIYELTAGGAAYDKTVTDGVYEKAGQRWLVVDKKDKSSILTLAPMDANGKEITGNRFTVDMSNSTDADEKSYIIDYTDSTPKSIEIGNVSTGDEVMIFYFQDNGITKSGKNLDRSGGDADYDMVQIIKVVD